MKNSKISNEYLNNMALMDSYNILIIILVTNFSQTWIDHIFVDNIDMNKNTPYIGLVRCDINLMYHYATAKILPIV